MGVQIGRRIQYVLGTEFYNSIVDFEMEINPQDFSATFTQVTATDRVAINVGAIGYNKGVGLYFPTYLMEKHPDWNLDFWRSLLNPERRSAFPRAGTGPKCGGKPGP
ncbi:hypothetical protein HDU79_008288, partial [Rhizoclosmatium sp. JEL0117]